MSAEDRSPKGRGPQHTTHHDDCGCLTARYEANIATLDAMNRAHASAYAKEIDRQEARIATLEAELAQTGGELGIRANQVIAWKAHANALRDALEDVLNNATCACYEDGEPGHCPRCAVAYQEARTALAQTPAQALAAHNAEALERAATCAESYLWNLPAIQSQVGANCGDAIRALAAQAATHSVPDGTSEVKP